MYCTVHIYILYIGLLVKAFKDTLPQMAALPRLVRLSVEWLPDTVELTHPGSCDERRLPPGYGVHGGNVDIHVHSPDHGI